MKPIIIDISEMSESTVMYESKPNPACAVLICLLTALLTAAGIWMYFFQIDVVEEAGGILCNSQGAATITNVSGGRIQEYHMEDGNFVKKGSTLVKIDTSELEQQKKIYEQEKANTANRIEILEAYLNVLNGEEEALEIHRENPYYSEFLTRKKAMQISRDILYNNGRNQEQQYINNISSIDRSILSEQEKENKWEQMLSDIRNHTNTFSPEEVYYHAAIESYLSSYHMTEKQYNQQIGQMEKQTNKEDELSEEDKPQNNTDIMNQSSQIQRLEAEKEQALNNLKADMIASVEQSLAQTKENLKMLNSNREQIQGELEIAKGGEEDLSADQIKTEEINRIYAELENCKEKIRECEDNLEVMQTSMSECVVKAQCEGYLNLSEVKVKGDYAAPGEIFGEIVPCNENGAYKVQIYIDNQAIGKIREGQEVKYELPSYPSSEYGIIQGKIVKISKDVKIDQKSGMSYYTAEAVIQHKENRKKEMELKPGMAVNARIVTEQKSVWEFLIEKVF